MQDDFFLGTKPLETFYPVLVRRKRIQTAIKKEFGLAAKGIIDKLTAGIPLEGDERGAEDTIAQIVSDGGRTVHWISAMGSYDEIFPIVVVRFGPVFKIQALEFDDIGYFDSKESAISAAEFNYESFISALKELEDEDEPAE